MDDLSYRIKIAIAFGPKWVERLKSSNLYGYLERSLRRQLEALIAQFGLPGALSLDLHLMGRHELLGAKAFGIYIDGQPCRISLERATPDYGGPDALISLLVATVFHNRELISAPNYVEAYWRHTLPRQSLQPLGISSAQGLQDLLIYLVRRGHHVSSTLTFLRTAMQNWSKDQDTQAAIDCVVERQFPTSITIQLGRRQYDLVFGKDPGLQSATAKDTPSIEEMFKAMRNDLFYDVGVRFPALECTLDQSLWHDDFRVQLNRVYAPARTGLRSEQLMVDETTERLALLRIKAEPVYNPANGMECAIIQKDNAIEKLLEERGLTTWGPRDYLVLSVGSDLRRHAALFLTTTQVEYHLGLLARGSPILVSRAIERFGVLRLTHILRDLVEEDISIRELRSILEALLSARRPITLDWAKYIALYPSEMGLIPLAETYTGAEFTNQDLGEHIRIVLKAYHSYKYTGQGSTLIVYLVSPDIETRIQTSDQNPLTPAECDRLIEAIYRVVSTEPRSSQKRVILTTLGVRRRLRHLLEREFPQLPVLSYQELQPDIEIQPIARIS